VRDAVECSETALRGFEGERGVGVWYFHFFAIAIEKVPLDQKFPEAIIVSQEL
jgi:hypothetical protein